jgi:hypothetical protein
LIGHFGTENSSVEFCFTLLIWNSNKQLQRSLITWNRWEKLIIPFLPPTTKPESSKTLSKNTFALTLFAPQFRFRTFSSPLLFLFYFIIHMFLQSLDHFSPLPLPPPLPPTPPLPLPPTRSIPGRNYFALISNFVEERV